MPKKPPYFPLYANDWLSSPAIALMTPEQEGAYVRLLCYAWADSGCSIPDDFEALKSLSRLFKDSLKIVIQKCFISHPTIPGRLTNERLFAERMKYDAITERKSDGGKKSVKSRLKGQKMRSKDTLKSPQRVFKDTSKSLSHSESDTDIKKKPFLNIPLPDIPAETPPDPAIVVYGSAQPAPFPRPTVGPEASPKHDPAFMAVWTLACGGRWSSPAAKIGAQRAAWRAFIELAPDDADLDALCRWVESGPDPGEWLSNVIESGKWKSGAASPERKDFGYDD